MSGSSAGRSASSSRIVSSRGSWSPKSTSSLVAKYRKKVRADTSAASAISSTVVPSKPFSVNSRMADSSRARRVASFLRSRRPSSCTEGDRIRSAVTVGRTLHGRARFDPGWPACSAIRGDKGLARATSARLVGGCGVASLRLDLVTAPFTAATQVQSDSLTDACGDDPGTACRFVLDHTSTEWLAKLVDFLVARPLKILFIVLLAWVAAKISRRLIRRFSSQLAGSAESGRLRRARDRTPSVLLSQQQPSLRSAARAETVSQVLRSLSNAVIYSFAAVYVMAELGLQLGPLIAGAGIVGIALGFGAQSLVRDFLSGMFMLMEDQYGVGDVIDCGEAVGTVEAVSLRTTRLRDVNGTVWHVPNGQIMRVGNKSQQWARALLDILVAHDTDVDRANALLKEVADQVTAQEPLLSDVLEDPEVWGVENLAPEGVTLRLVVKTRPGAQWAVMRALRIAIQEAFAAEGIKMPAVAGTVTVQAADPGSRPVPDARVGSASGDRRRPRRGPRRTRHDAPAEDGWVLVPLAAAFVIGIVILVVLGLDSGAAPFA